MSNRMELRGRVAALVLCAIMFCLTAAASAAQAQTADLSNIKYPRLNEIEIPKVETVTLRNGMVLMMIEDNELPLVKMKALVRVGTIYEPRDCRGVVELMGQTWRTGGTASMSGDQIDEVLEALGSSVESSLDKTAGTLSANSLTENFDKTLSIFADILMGPKFSEDKIDLAKTRMRSAIARRNDEPMGLLMREYPKLVYGADSPYARQIEYADVDKLSRKDLLDFHTRYVHPNALILGVWGDFKASDMKKKLERTFAGWKPATINYPEVPEVDMTLTPSVNYIEKTDIDQCFVLMGHLCMRLDDPDYPSFYIMSDILGSSWASRIFNKVRTEKGLAYAVGGGLMSRFDHPGAFYAFASTKFSSTYEATSTMIEEVRKITEAEVTDEELARSKEAYLNSFAFQFDSVGKILERLMTYKYYGYPEDFLQRTRTAIEKVTREDVLKVAKNRLHPDRLIILAVGDASQFEKPLASFGAVNSIDITIPEPAEAIPQATQATAERGKEILDKAVAAMGGAKRLASVERFSCDFKATVSTPGGELSLNATLALAYPDRLRLDLQTPMGAMVQVLNKDKGWMSTAQGVLELQGSQVDELKKQLQFDPIHVFKALASGSAQAQYLGEVELDSLTVSDLFVTLEDGATLHLYVRPSDYMVVGSMRRAVTPEGPTEITEVFSDFREVAGIVVSFASVQKTPTKTISSVATSEVRINPPLEKRIFERPSE